MRYKVLNTTQTVRESIYRIMHRKKITKKVIEKKMGCSYPTILCKIENPGNFKFSELLELCNILDEDFNDLLIKIK